MFCNSVLFTKTTGITKMTKMTKTTQTATSKGVDCWICGNHGCGKRSIKVGKRPIKEGKRPINATGQFSGTHGGKNCPSKKAH